MSSSLAIQIEAENKEDIDKIFKHVVGEITENRSLKSMDIECNSLLADGWMKIETKGLKGKYRWKKERDQRKELQKDS